MGEKVCVIWIGVDDVVLGGAGVVGAGATAEVLQLAIVGNFRKNKRNCDRGSSKRYRKLKM